MTSARAGKPEGIGKSAYVNHVLADLCGYQSCQDRELPKVMYEKREMQLTAHKWSTDWNSTKDLILYLREDVVKLWKTMLIKGIRWPSCARANQLSFLAP